jgi:DNA-binding NarL/FixJ family response regulator
MKIVIADDSSLWRDRIKSLLADIDELFVVSEAENGIDALQIIREKEPDLVILDIRMSGLNGIEVLKKIRELRMKVRVCMLTNYPYLQYRKRCLEAGADYFLSKTEDFEEIEIIVRNMLRAETQHNNKSLLN